jgi:hypothetical protein
VRPDVRRHMRKLHKFLLVGLAAIVGFTAYAIWYERSSGPVGVLSHEDLVAITNLICTARQPWIYPLQNQSSVVFAVTASTNGSETYHYELKRTRHGWKARWKY